MNPIAGSTAEALPVVGALHRPGGRTGAGRGVQLVVRLPEGCPDCRRWLDQNREALLEAVHFWGGRLDVEAQPPGAGRAAAGWLAVLDEWDEVFHVAPLAAGRPFPTVETVAEWIRFVAIQCEECERPEWPWVS